MNGGIIKKKKLQSLGVKCIVIIGVVIGVILLPDILFAVRNGIKEIPFFGEILVSDISNTSYIQIVATMLANCIAIYVSIIAYQFSKETGKVILIEHKKKLNISAENLKECIKHNASIIYEVKKSTVRPEKLNKLVNNDEINRIAIDLYMEGCITEKQREFCIKYSRKIDSILLDYKKNAENDLVKKVEKFCEYYLETDSSIIEYSTEMTELLDKLDKISKGD